MPAQDEQQKRRGSTAWMRRIGAAYKETPSSDFKAAVKASDSGAGTHA